MTDATAANPMSRDRLLELIGELCNGSITEADGAALDLALRTHPQARVAYINYMWMHGSLYGDAAELLQDPAAVRETRADASAALAGLLDDDQASPGMTARARRKSPRVSQWLALAAALIGVAALSSALTLWQQGREIEAGRVDAAQTGDSSADEAPRDAAVARITGTHNCVWATPGGGAGYGAPLPAGERLELQEGLAEITFNNGATLLLEGPASFVVAAPDQVKLDAGRLAAVVPGSARKFHVHTPGLDVWEVGAEFGLVTQTSGSTELHVFNGLVKASVLDSDGRAFEQLELNGAEAARINPLATTVTEFPADDAQFVRNLLPTTGPHDGLLAYEGFRYPSGPLEAQNGGFGWAGPWFNISIDEQAGPESNGVQMGSLAVEGVVPVGNHAAQTSHRNRIRRSLATSVGGVFDTAGLVENQDGVRLVGRDGKRAYISFLQQVSQTDDGFYGVEFHRGDGNSNRVLCIGNGADGSGYGATSNVNVYGAANLPALGAENTDVNFIVIRIDFGVADRDVVRVYRNPESLRDESLCQADALLRGNFAFDRVSFGNFDGAKVHEVDELRVGTHFLAVTGRWGSHPKRLQRRIAFQPIERFRFARREGQVAAMLLIDDGARMGVADERG